MNKAIYCAPRKKGKEEDDKTKNKTNEANKEAPIKKKKVLQQSYYDSLTDEEKVTNFIHIFFCVLKLKILIKNNFKRSKFIKMLIS